MSSELKISQQYNSVFPPLEPPACDDRLLWQVWTAEFHLPALIVADEIGLFPLLEKTPSTCSEVVDRMPLGTRGAEILLGLLTSLGFLVQHRNRFYLTATSRSYLLPDSPFYWGNFLRLIANRPMSATSFKERLAKDREEAGQDTYMVTRAWKSGEMEPHFASFFTAAMHSQLFSAAVALARQLDLSGVTRLLDAGGGSGCFSLALALRYPLVRFTVMDLPVVCVETRKYIEHYRLEGPVDTFAARLFEDSWPSDNDGVLFSNIFHNWDRAACLALAAKSYDVLPPGGRVFLYEMLLNDTGDGPEVALGHSANMLAVSPGKQYTFGELAETLEETGFTAISLESTHAYFSLVSARKP